MHQGIKISSQDRCYHNPIKDHPIFDLYCLFVNLPVAVRIGDLVQEGQAIVEDNGIDLLVHSPVTGIVKKIEMVQDKTCVSIQSNKQIEPKKYQFRDPFKVTAENLIEELRQCGVVGCGSLAVPTYQKIKQSRLKAHTIIVNGIDCEPFLSANRQLFLEKSKEIVRAVQLLKMLLGAKNIVIAITHDKILRKALEQFIFDETIEIKEFSRLYPLGYDRLLIYHISGIQLPLHQDIIDTGYFVQSATTLYAIYEALFQKKPMIEKVITVDGAYCLEYGNFRVKIGTLMTSFMRPFAVETSYVMFTGGPMHGYSIEHERSVGKSINGIIISEKSEDPVEQDCIFCTACNMSCPIGLEPYRLVDMWQNQELGLSKKHGILECIECNICSYVCPSFIPLGRYVSQAKKEVFNGGV